jgi:hypothetical protein
MSEIKSKLERLYLAGLINIDSFVNLGNALLSGSEKIKSIANDLIEKKSEKII